MKKVEDCGHKASEQIPESLGGGKPGQDVTRLEPGCGAVFYCPECQSFGVYSATRDGRDVVVTEYRFALPESVVSQLKSNR